MTSHIRLSIKRGYKHFLRMLEGTKWPGARQDCLCSVSVRSLQWLRAHELPTGGIRVHGRHPNAYPEVSGYLIPTLLACGERDLALRLLRWLVSIQRADGSFTDPDRGEPYVFDTGQVLRGLLAGMEMLPQAREAAKRAAEYLCARMKDEGRGGFGTRYKGEIPETVHLYVLPPLMEAADKLGEPRYGAAAGRCLEHYVAHPHFLGADDLTHFLAYQLEALIDLGRQDLARPAIERLEALQGADGSVRGMGEAGWVCVPGLAQLAVCWYKIGRPGPAEGAMSWLDAHQEPSGGFLGGYGPGASYFPGEEPSWAVKFYLDAHLLRTVAFFDGNAHLFPAEVSGEDGRLRALLAMIEPGDRVLEVGCGKGRFLKAIKAVVPECECVGVDVSAALLGVLPEGIQPIGGSLEAIPCPADDFDVVFSVEAIEHSPNPEAAVAEMIRVARPGGRIGIIDKQRAHWGRMACPPWERWPEREELCKMLRRGCDNVAAEPVGYEGRPASDGLMLFWRGGKRGALRADEWARALSTDEDPGRLVEDVRGNRLSPWGQAVMLATLPGERVLEVGSGTGRISLQLALAGRDATLLDNSERSLEFAKRCADLLGVRAEFVKADAARSLPFPDGRFGCAWSSGLLEHFAEPQRRAILREMARVSSRRVVAIVPNAACLAYVAGKDRRERAGTWFYGLELPIRSLRDDFQAAGLRVADEFTVGSLQGLEFLPPADPLRKAISRWLSEAGIEAADRAGQGYLLYTIGEKGTA